MAPTDNNDVKVFHVKQSYFPMQNDEKIKSR